jgi:septum site-determining protein MinC
MTAAMIQAQTGRSAQKSDDGFELKESSLSLLAVILKSADLAELAGQLSRKLGDTPEVFNHDPVLIDLTQMARPAAAAPVSIESGQLTLVEWVADVDLAAVILLLRAYRMQPVAVLGANPAELEQAIALGLAAAPQTDAPSRPEAPRSPPVVQASVEVPVAARTMIIDKPLRSGQQVYAKDADLIVLALVNHGAEVIADGNIHVYAPLRGKAIAGARGNAEARIFASSMEAELVAIAGIYRTAETALPAQIFGKSAQVRLDGEKLLIEALKL